MEYLFYYEINMFIDFNDCIIKFRVNNIFLYLTFHLIFI